MQAAAASLRIDDRVYQPPVVDIDAAQRHLWCLPGKSIVVVQHYHEQAQSGFILPDTHTRKVAKRLPVGRVAAAHSQTQMAAGDDVIVDGRLAKRVRNVEIGDFKVPAHEGEVWLFGVTSPAIETGYPVAPNRYAFATVQSGGREMQSNVAPEPCHEIEPRYRAVDRTMRVRGAMLERPWVILRLPEKGGVHAGGVIHLVDHMTDRDDMAIVEAVSPNCKHVRPGHVVWYQRRALTAMYALGPDFATLPEFAIFAIVSHA